MPYTNIEKRRAYHREYMRKHYRRYAAAQRAYQQTDSYKQQVRKYRATKRGRELANAALRCYFKTVKGKKARLRYEARHPEKIAARSAVLIAKRSGRLKRQLCEVCGARNVEAHHDDYRQPLKVRWLCKKHHECVDLKVNGSPVSED